MIIGPGKYRTERDGVVEVRRLIKSDISDANDRWLGVSESGVTISYLMSGKCDCSTANCRFDIVGVVDDPTATKPVVEHMSLEEIAKFTADLLADPTAEVQYCPIGDETWMGRERCLSDFDFARCKYRIKPKKVELWVNVHQVGIGPVNYKSEHVAKLNATAACLRTVRLVEVPT